MASKQEERMSQAVSKELNLKGKKMGAAAVMMVEAEGLKKKFNAVNLQGNKLEDDQMKLLGEVLLRTNVTSLDISKNRVTSRGLVELANLLKTNTTLQYLKTDASRSSKAVLKTIEIILNQNRQLHECGNGIAEELKMRGRSLTEFPRQLSLAHGIRRLDLSLNDLRRIPFEIVQLYQLEVLVMEGNKLKSIPLHLCQLSHLSKLRLKGNKIRRLPGELCMMAALEDIDVSNNRIKRVPLPLARKLKVLKVSGNRLQLPSDVKDDAMALDYLQNRSQKEGATTDSWEDSSDRQDDDDSSNSMPSTSSTTTAFASAHSLARKLKRNKEFLLEALEDEVTAGAVGAEESLLDSIVFVLCYFEAFPIAVEKLLTLELRNLNDSQLMLRADSFTTRLVAKYMAIVGRPYLSKLVTPTAELIMQESVEIEVAPEKVSSKKELARNQERLLFIADVFLNSVFLVKKVPLGIRKVLCVVARVTTNYFPDFVQQSLGNVFFLRFLCPQIVTVECQKDSAKRTIILIAKLLQNLANESHFSKESGMQCFDGFIDKNVERMHIFYKELTTTEERRPPSPTVRHNPFPSFCQEEEDIATRSSSSSPSTSCSSSLASLPEVIVVGNNTKEAAKKSKKSKTKSKKGSIIALDTSQQNSKKTDTEQDNGEDDTPTIDTITTPTETSTDTAKSTPNTTSTTCSMMVQSASPSGSPVLSQRRVSSHAMGRSLISSLSMGKDPKRKPLEHALDNLYKATLAKRSASGITGDDDDGGGEDEPSLIDSCNTIRSRTRRRKGTITRTAPIVDEGGKEMKDVKGELIHKKARCLRGLVLHCLSYYDADDEDDTSSLLSIIED